MAVGAPFEGNGIVYIYLGSAKGIALKPSQKILAPISYLDGKFDAQSFGHAISKGADIDDNKYPGRTQAFNFCFFFLKWKFESFYIDIAIGAPDLDIVYVYQSYPVAEVVAYIVPETKEITLTDASIKLKACWYLKSKHALTEKISNNIHMQMKNKLRPSCILF